MVMRAWAPFHECGDAGIPMHGQVPGCRSVVWCCMVRCVLLLQAGGGDGPSSRRRHFQCAATHANAPPFGGAHNGRAVCGNHGKVHWVVWSDGCQSQESAPPDWYSITRVSKKLRSFFRSIISLIQGKGFSSLGKSTSSPICVARRLAM